MNALDWRKELLDAVAGSLETVPHADGAVAFGSVDAAAWGRLAERARTVNCRWVAGWGDDLEGSIAVHVLFERDGLYLAARTRVTGDAVALRSHANIYPAADRSERHMADLLGVGFEDHPDGRRWVRHQAWAEGEFPLRAHYPLAGTPARHTRADSGYPFLSAQGSGVYEIPVGPVHAGIIEPGHFRFQAVGEMVLNLEEHLGYVHKGIEKVAVGRDAAGLARLAGRVSGDSTVAHAWAACRAMEQAAGLALPPRADCLRGVYCERERVANHLGDIGAVLNDVAFTFGFYQYSRLREEWSRLSHRLFGHRFMMDRVVPGGVAVDLDGEGRDAIVEQIRRMRPDVIQLISIAEDNASVEDRLEGTGYLSEALAREFGTLGYVARASNIDFDLRRDVPYPPYDRFPPMVTIYHYGDVASRVKVRGAEILASFDLLETLVQNLPDGPIAAPWNPPDGPAEGLGLVEGWRGEILSYVRFDESGRIARFYPRDPSCLNWPALEKLVRDNIVPDFPVCNKSVNGSYSGNDL